MLKPKELADKTYIARLTAEKTNVPDEVVVAIVQHVFKGLFNALETNNLVEISGLGTLKYNTKRAEKAIVSIQKCVNSLEQKPSTDKRQLHIDGYKNQIVHITKKLNE